MLLSVNPTIVFSFEIVLFHRGANIVAITRRREEQFKNKSETSCRNIVAKQLGGCDQI